MTTAGVRNRCTEAERLPLKDLTAAQRAERQRTMATIKARSQQHASAAAQALPAEPAQCGFSSTEFVNSVITNPSRFLSCSDTLLVIAVFQITPVPELLGEFYWEDQQWASYSVTSLNWTHGVETLGYVAGAFGTLAEGIDGEMYCGCFLAEGICSATSLAVPDPQPVAIAPGGIYSFGWDESDTGVASKQSGAVDTLNPYLGADWEVANAGEPTELLDTGGLAARCDSQVTSTDGCADQGCRRPARDGGDCR
jgi:hypothetical protein